MTITFALGHYYAVQKLKEKKEGRFPTVAVIGRGDTHLESIKDCMTKMDERG